MKIPGYDRASILDLAIISGGNLDCAMSFCEQNGISITSDVEIGKEYDTRTIENKRQDLKNRIDIEGVKPATALCEANVSACPYGGIGYMGIEIDFSIS